MSIKIGVVPNDADGTKLINDLKQNVRKQSRYSNYTVRVRTYGRCHNKIQAFAQTGRRHYKYQSNSNSIYSLKSPEARFCYAWAVYLDIRPKRVKSQAYPDGILPTGGY